jgi:tripartite-type tricarboxylate transporter receptor subunit TctC
MDTARRQLLGALVAAPFCRVARADGARQSGARAGIRIVVAYPPGGVSDLCARVLATLMSSRLGTPVHVENQPGAGGAVALRALARPSPDRRTIVFSAITPLALDPQLGIASESGRGVLPLMSFMLTPSLLVGTPAFAGSSFEDLLAHARAAPSALRWATSGYATTGHLVLQAICRTFDIAVTHVPYKGGGQQLADALSGQFELLSTNLAPLQLGYVTAGKMTALAVGAPHRSMHLRAVPTLQELGCPDANLVSEFGLFVPLHSDGAWLREVNAAVNSALQDATLLELLQGGGNVATGGTMQSFAENIRAATLRFSVPDIAR